MEIANTSWSGIIQNLKTNAHTPPLYYFLLKVWMALFGADEAGARSLSALFYLFSIPAVYFFGKTLFDRKTGLLAAFLFLANPMAIQFAQFARMYSLLGLLAVLSALFFLRQFYTGAASKKNWTAWVAVNLAGTFTHYWFFFLLLAQGIVYLWLFSKSSFRSFALAMLASLAPFFLLWTPVLWIQATNGGTSGIPRPGPGTLAETLLIFWGGGKKAALLYGAFLALPFVRLEGWKLKFRLPAGFTEFLRRKEFLILLAVLTVSLGTPWLISQFNPIYIATKYTMLALFAVLLLIAPFLARFGDRILLPAFCALLFMVTVGNFTCRRLHPPPDSIRSLTEFLLEKSRPGDLLLLPASAWGGTEYYLKRLGEQNRFIRFPFPAEVAAHPCWPDLNRWTEPYLKNEADALLNRVEAQIGKAPARIWLLNGNLPMVDDAVKTGLDARFRPLDEKALGESYPPLRGVIHAYQKKPQISSR